MRIVDSDVNAFATETPITLPASYRFERLPSQQAMAAQSAAIEALLQTELEKVGMQRDDAVSLYSVSFDTRMFRDPHAPWDDARYLAGYGVPYPFVTRYGTVLHYPALMLRFDFPYYRREISLLVRRLSDGKLVFESHASHAGSWADDELVLPAMFEAALRDFPNPPRGPRRINIEVAP